jgi:hypothetical protein
VQPEQNDTRYTGDLEAWQAAEQKFLTAAEQASVDAAAIAWAIRAGLSELAVDLSRIRAFGAGSAQRKEGAGAPRP